MTSKNLNPLIGFLAFVVLSAGATIAAWDHEATSSSSRGRSLETLWHGVLALLGQEQNATGGMTWLGRGVALVGVGLFVLYVVRRVRAPRPAAPHQQPPHQQAPDQPAPQQLQPQVQWSTGVPQPTPPPVAALSWSAVTSGPTPLPPIPQQPEPQQPDGRQEAEMTREVIIPPLPPGWGRS